MTDTRELDRLIKLAESVKEQIEDELARPDDVYPVGAILTWERTFERGGNVYTYVAIKYDDNRWRTSQGRDYRWRELVDKHLRHADAESVYWVSELTLAEELP